MYKHPGDWIIEAGGWETILTQEKSWGIEGNLRHAEGWGG